ncbi:MAG: hypothetical protein WCW29_03855 [Candidatus Paceibacterota bacterium]|jgi:hypothetical protein
MKKVTYLYLVEIVVFLIPFFVFKTNLLSYIAIGFIFVLPVNIFGLIFLRKEIKQIKIYNILHYLILVVSLFFVFLSWVTYNAARSIMNL